MGISVLPGGRARRRRARGRAAALAAAVPLLLLALLACGGGNPDEKLAKQLQPVGSWLATLAMAGEKWIANSVPASFVRSSGEAADKAFEKAAEAAAESAARPPLRHAALRLTAGARSAGAGLRRAVAAGDRGAAARQAARLAALHEEAEALAKSAGGGG